MHSCFRLVIYLMQKYFHGFTLSKLMLSVETRKYFG